MLFKYCCAFVVIVASVGAQIPSLGFCPDYLPMTEFDMNRFLGKWYEAERYFTFSEVVSRCVVTDYARANSGRIYVSNEVTNRLTGVKRIINGNLQLVGKGDEGKLNVKYATTPIPTETTLMVLDTDYDDFAVVWSCTGFGPVHAQNAWLMTRDRLPSGTVLQRAYGVLDKFKISRTFFVKTDQEGCAIAASDINAANGITATSTVPEATGADQRTDERSAPIPNEKLEAYIKIEEENVAVAENVIVPEKVVEKVEAIQLVVVPETVVVPEKVPITPELVAAPVVDVAEKVAASEIVAATPETVAVPEFVAEPEMVVVPEIVAVPEIAAVPEIVAIPEIVAASEVIVSKVEKKPVMVAEHILKNDPIMNLEEIVDIIEKIENIEKVKIDKSEQNTLN